MKKNFRKAIKSFKKLGDANQLTFAQNVAVSMGNAAATFPAPVPAIPALNDQVTAFGNLIQSSAARDKIQVASKNQAREVLSLMLSQLCDYVNMVAQGDEVALSESGFGLSKVPEPVTIKAPTDLVLTDGANNGELFLKCKTVMGASGYLFQCTSDTMLAEASWTGVPVTASSYTFKGLTKGTTYFFRIIAIGAKLQSIASIVVNRVSQ